ncbi:alpha/beta hydrolase [Nocardia goodfellowii]|uniref:Pimeloyl-ACP methyl ester carboxylesterase n=1 Tax=Nocardia goodfellowii TaxID=882446 RepID=A0ABS4QHB3_9NOCA|nr:alpha/beta hydrolase [Nocardia goodfellowii]MBP2190464.1 pimeloyl-ACP methyl ester carboxylesterase [Nocardia goodfellowii]
MRWTRAAVVASTLSIVLTGCGAGPSDRPGVAVERPAVGDAATTSKAPVAPPKQATVPKTDLSWRECTTPTLNLLGLGPAPAGLVLECAEYSTPIDTQGTVIGSFRTGAMRARVPQTPPDAAPLVLTSGTDRSSTATLAGLAVGSGGAGLLTTRPIVAVDRRGLGTSQPVDCLPAEIRRGLADNGQFDAGAGNPAEAISALSQEATISCRDFLQPYEGLFDAPHAADDIEQLRKQWQVDNIDLLGTGNGAKVALSYARKFGDHLSRLVLDSPEAVNTDSVTREEQRLQGAEAALTAFAQRCKAMNCSLGADPRAAIADLVNKASTGGLGDVSAKALLTAITGFLGSPRADQSNRVTELADALSAAGRGDGAALGNLILRESAATASDGQFVNRCTDTQQPPTPGKATELAMLWAQKYPVFGKTAALSLLDCSAWPVPSPAPMPEKLDLSVLVLNSVADPVKGNGGTASVTGALGAAGARHATVNWQGWGHPVFTHSGCAQRSLLEYLAEAKLPADGTACPA